jgi:hypothetical protein
MPHHKPLPPREWLLENLRYEPETGLFWWAKPTSKRVMSKPVGWKNYNCKTGLPHHLVIDLQGGKFMAHRLAWLMMTGNDPGRMTIDHINRDPFDNKWANLRLADQSLQLRNRRNTGASPHKGVCFNAARRKWKAQVSVKGKCKYLGQFDTEEEAAAAAAPYFIP